MTIKKQHIKNIITANNNNRLAFFIGAGVSKSSETNNIKIPNWAEIILGLKDDLNIDDENDYLKIAQLYYLEFKEYSYYRKLKSYFSDGLEPSSVHKILYDLSPEIIITTNWDNLLEKARDETYSIYDVISSDKDLVKSTLQRKIIKMHGDFVNHNIVFKEDDYLNYQYNFPLIENYIKSILSTYTVVFLGYSYSDINLKLITKWLQNHSKVRPPIYMTVFDENTSQSRYLEAHGITPLVLETQVENIDSLDNYSSRVWHFLNTIKNPINLYNQDSISDVIDIIYEKLVILDSQDYILRDQIQGVLSNCGFIYDDSIAMIEFYDRLKTNDYDKKLRNIYSVFVKYLANEKFKTNSKVIKILSIFNKANISGVIISKDTCQEKKYLPIDHYRSIQDDNYIDRIINFDFNIYNSDKRMINNLLRLGYVQYQAEDLEKSFYLFEKSVKTCLKEQNYAKLFISMFNRNTVLKEIKRNVDLGTNKYKDLTEYNLKEKFYSFPKDIQQAIEPIYKITDFCYLYRVSHIVANQLEKKQDSKRIIDSGGFVFNINISEFTSKHENLVAFMIYNSFLMDSYTEFKTVNKHLINIALVRQSNKSKTILSKHEIYSCIKYLDTKVIKIMFKHLYDTNNEVPKNRLSISEEDKKWLIDKAFANISNKYIENNSPFKSTTTYLENIVFIISLIKLNKNQVDKIFDKLSETLRKTLSTTSLYQCINSLLTMQYTLYKTEIDSKVILLLIKDILRKFVSKESNAYDYFAISTGDIANVYNYAKIKDLKIDDVELVKSFLDRIIDSDVSDNIRISNQFLLGLYNISNKEIKKLIKNYILSINSCDTKNKYEFITFELMLLIQGFKEINASLLDSINEYLSSFEVEGAFSTSLYTIEAQLKYLVEEKEILKLKELHSKTTQIISKFDGKGISSIW